MAHEKVFTWSESYIETHLPEDEWYMKCIYLGWLVHGKVLIEDEWYIKKFLLDYRWNILSKNYYHKYKLIRTKIV